MECEVGQPGTDGEKAFKPKEQHEQRPEVRESMT